MGPLAASDRERRPLLPWAFPPWFMPLWTGAVAWQWWRVARDDLRGLHPDAEGARLATAALAGATGRLLGFGLEAGFYVGCWAALGRRLPFWRFASWVVSLSMLEVVATTLRHDLSPRHGVGIAWAVLLGPVAGHDAAAPARGVVAAFGTLGLVTLLRIFGTARAQWQALGVQPWAPLALTAATWAACRLAWWALGDLARGRSALP